jgi:hypothetical protein
MKQETIKKRLEEIIFNENIDNPYININVAAQWIYDNFTPKIKPQVEWIEEWTELFPKDKKSNGHLIYNKPKDCVSKMQTFVKDNPNYTKELIFAATEAYLHEREEEDWAYTRTASNFIHHRVNGGLLATWCEKLINEKKEKPKQIQTFFI